MFDHDEREVCFRSALLHIDNAVSTVDCLIEYPEMNALRMEIVECLDNTLTRLRAHNNEALEPFIKQIEVKKKKISF